VTAYQVNQEQSDDEFVVPSQKEMQRILSENLHGGDIQNMRILSYQNKAPGAPDVSHSFLFQ
jgi:cell division cycle protein 20 (cofactor of APC complex)